MKVRLRHEVLRRRIATGRISQNSWAVKLGVSSGHLSELINGKRPYPNAATRRLLLEGLGLEFDELFHVESDEQEEVSKEPERPGSEAESLFEIRGGRYRLKLDRRRTTGTGESRMKGILYDLRHGLRSLARRPGFTLPALLAMALGIGGSSIVFTLVQGVLLKPLGYPEVERLVSLSEAREGRERSNLSYPNAVDLEREVDEVERVGVYTGVRLTLLDVGDAQRISGVRASSGLLEVLDVQPVLGRLLQPKDDGPGAEPVVLLSHGFWRRRFGESAEALGSRLILEEVPHTIVGVLPADFRFPLVEDAELWVGLTTDSDLASQRGLHIYRGLAQLAPGTSRQQAQAAASSFAKRLAELYPDEQTGRDFLLVDLKRQLTAEVRPALITLLAAVGLVLLIACSNVANLLLARGLTRSSEWAVRAAMGAPRRRLFLQVVSEGMTLSFAGAVLGLALAFPVIRSLHKIPLDLPRLGEVGLSGPVMLFICAAAALSGLVLSLPAALSLLVADPVPSLKRQGRGSVPAAGRMRWALVTVETALSVLLLVGAGLFMRSFYNLMNVAPGYQPQGVLTFALSAPLREDTVGPSRARRYADVMEALRTIPSAESVAGTVNLPLESRLRIDFLIEGGPPPPPGEEFHVHLNVVSPDYFKTLQIPLKRGRSFRSSDRLGSAGVAIVNEAMVRRYWPNEDPIGKRVTISVGFDIEGEPDVWEIVGVSSDVSQAGIGAPVEPGMSIPSEQQTWPLFNFVMRTNGDPKQAFAQVRQVVARVAPDEPLLDLTTLDSLRSESLARERLAALVIGGFAALALALALVGVYGVLSYSVGQRRQEIGLRMALGAAGGQIVRMVMARGLLPVVVGLLIGGGAAVLLGPSISDQLFRLDSLDPLTFVASAVLFMGAAAAACYIPAQRAARTDPLAVLQD